MSPPFRGTYPTVVWKTWTRFFYGGAMTRAHVARLPSEQFTAYARTLLERACPATQDAPLFDRLMRQASCSGLTYVEALLYVIDMRKATLT